MPVTWNEPTRCSPHRITLEVSLDDFEVVKKWRSFDAASPMPLSYGRPHQELTPKQYNEAV